MSLWSSVTELLKSAVPTNGPLQALAASLAPLDKLQAGLADRARRFVFDGDDPQLLLQLPQHAQVGEALGNPGAPYFFGTSTDMLKLGRKSAAERRKYYTHAFDGQVPLAVLGRLGRLLVACDVRKQLLRPESTLPDWIYMLLMDGCIRDNDRWHSPGVDNDKSAQGKRLSIDIESLTRLLALDELGSLDLIELLFERKGIAEYQRSTYDPVLRAEGVDDFLRTHPSELSEALERLSAAGRSTLAATLCSPALAQAYPELLARLAADASKSTRDAAGPGLHHLDPAVCLAAVQGVYQQSGKSTERALAVELLARHQGEAALPWLRQVREGESSKPVLEAIDRALSRGMAAQSSNAGELPQPPPLPALAEQKLAADAIDLLEQNLQELRQSAQLAADREAADKAAGKQTYGHAERNLKDYQRIDRGHFESLLRRLNGEQPLHATSKAVGTVVGAIRDDKLSHELGHVMLHKQRLYSRPDFGLMQILRTVRLIERHDRSYFWRSWQFSAWLQRRPADSLDLRQFALAFEQLQWPLRDLANVCLVEAWGGQYPMDTLPPERIWPFFAEHPEYIEEGLGLRPSQAKESYQQFQLGLTLRVVGTFPVVPAAWIPRLLELALGEHKTHRPQAQQILAKLPDLGPRVLEACSAGKQELRLVAVQWLVDLDYRQALPALRKLLAKESKEIVRAALISALETFGDDISTYLAPARLLAEADKGLKAKAPADIAWFDLDALPAAKWRDGSAVPAAVLRWWVVLAGKLKTPGGNPLLERYLGLLDADSAAAFGRAVLGQFIAQDTRRPSLAEAEAYANENADHRFANYQQMIQTYPQFADQYRAMTRERIFNEMKAEKLGIYLGSAIGAKGLLALIGRVPGHELATTVSQYMRDHHIRRAQIEALLEGLSLSDDPAAIQLLLAVSRRHRTASVQTKARLLVDQTAQRLGWSADELADRTIPTAGLDETGQLQLDYGTRQFQLRLDPELKLELLNADGKPIKALPDPRKDEDPALVKEAKAQLGASKKELKQVLGLQTGRLYEAMCAGRPWPLADWQQYLAGHPIVGRLAQRLIWIERADAAERLFRPSEDGSLLDEHDEEIELAPGSSIHLAHAAILSPAQVKAWQKHLKDYKVKPLFAQLDRPLPALTAPDGDVIDDRLGWSADSFGFRGAFTKLGYQRAQAEDGGFFYEYHKDYSSLGIRVCIEFTGNTLPEENVAASLRTLAFRRLGGNRYSVEPLRLSEVPPVLLAESYADYHKVAAIGAFDPHWESKSPW